MLEKPDLDDAAIEAALCRNYALIEPRTTFLPLGYDASAAVFRVESAHAPARFLKIRRDPLACAALAVPAYLRGQGLHEIVAPLATTEGSFAVMVDDLQLILYPFVEGDNGMDVGLSLMQWQELGHFLKQLHRVRLPAAIRREAPRETFVSPWRPSICRVQRAIDKADFCLIAQSHFATLWQQHRRRIDTIVARDLQLSALMQARDLPHVLCHADIHTANLLLDAAGALHVVDWDGVMLAPKERDLMFLVDDVGEQSAEAHHFRAGYGATAVDAVALAYYRNEWVVQELGDFGDRLFFLTDIGGEETLQDAVHGFAELFDPGDVADGADEAYGRLTAAILDSTAGCSD